MPTWKGIIGRGFRPQEFASYVETLTFGAWRPQFVVVHNTSVPRLSQWHATPGAQRMRNLETYYRDQMKWSAGPHLFVADDLIWTFTPLTAPGVHSPSWNGVAWGVEMVGDFESEPFSPAVRQNTIDALATLHALRGLDPDTIRFHKEDPKTTHTTCPGKNVVKSDVIAAVHARLATITTDGAAGEHLPTRLLDAESTVSRPTSDGPSAGLGRFTNIAATEFGGGDEAGMDSAYDGKVNPDKPEVSLPARVDAAHRGVRVMHVATGRSVVCRVNDVGPWNKTDDYWARGERPRAEAQMRDRTPAENGEVPSNDAGIDLTPAVYDALGIAGPVNTRQTHVDWEFV
jgi:hypothetical protein